ncbi:MAG: small subunit ribosomal protein [Thermoleophilales bacterium]|nr:small subunit ribosomal protein [Thermoleophilales bacterium]
MADVGIRELLEAGVHFGHQTRRWNPKMRRFIYGERAGIHIIDLQKTSELLERAQEFAANIAARGGTVMFVGTKKQARDAVKEAAEAAGMPYIDQRWLGGLLTNFQTISKRIKRLHDLDQWVEDGTLDLLPTRERIAAMKEREKLTTNLGGVRNLQRPPDAVFIVDLKTEEIGVREAMRLKIPIIGLVDTNVDPDPTTFPIPGNDDAIRSCKVIIDAIGDVVRERATVFRAQEEAAQREREEQQRREAEEKRRRDEEERVRKEAEEAAAREAQQALQAQQAQQAAQQGQQGDAAAQAAPQAGQAAAQPQQQERPRPARPRQQDRPSAPAPAAQPAAAEAPAAPAAAEAPAAPAEPEAPAAPAEAPAAEAAAEAPAAPAQAEAPAPEAATPAAEPEVPGGMEVREQLQAEEGKSPDEPVAREAVEAAERDKKASPEHLHRPRGEEEAEARASVEEADHDLAKSPDQEVSE